MTNKREDAAATLRIDGEMTIYQVAELKRALCEAQDGSAELELDLAAVTELDGAGAQLLMLAGRRALARDRRLRLVGHSPAVREVFDLLGLDAHFETPGERP